jgi:3-deoxy-manno-octulosonate cytidylyltransferase (CMP-KDO synthetase)
MVVGIIPARYASTRLPGKPLLEIDGKPMILHTYESASRSVLLQRVIVATDSQTVYDVCKNYGADVVMTPEDIQTGSDRIAYVARDLFDAEVIVNIQGDEPFIPGIMIDQALEPLILDERVEITTLAKRITSEAELVSPDVVKVVFDLNNNALYFSRSPIPHVRDAKSFAEAKKYDCYYKHIGLYAYRRDVLFAFTSLQQSELEKIEKLEQLRMLEHGMIIKVVETEDESLSVDTMEDLKIARKFYRAQQKKPKKEL